jgi:cysteine desulfurase
MRERYFDNAATTPLDPRVREAMLPYLDDAFGNAHSIHSLGLRAHDAVERARAQVAAFVGAEDPSQIFFTSGATEANNWVLNVADEIVISPFEHSSMREPALRRRASSLDNAGTDLTTQPQRRKDIDWEALTQFMNDRLAERDDPEMAAVYRRAAESLASHLENLASGKVVVKPPLLSVMAVNNEIGTTWNATDHALEGDLIHSDITQALGKIPITVAGLDFASFSAHKFYGPKGVGALYCKGQPPEPLILGGEQEHGYRGGTLNVPAIVGMGAAAEIALEEQPQDYEKATSLRQILIDGLNDLSDVQINGGNRTSPFILSVSFRGLEGETLVLEMDRAGYAISAGAACSSRSTEPSHVLTALRLQPEWLRGTVRVSFGRFNSKETTADFAKNLRSIVELLRTL